MKSSWEAASGELYADWTISYRAALLELQSLFPVVFRRAGCVLKPPLVFLHVFKCIIKCQVKKKKSLIKDGNKSQLLTEVRNLKEKKNSESCDTLQSEDKIHVTGWTTCWNMTFFI